MTSFFWFPNNYHNFTFNSHWFLCGCGLHPCPLHGLWGLWIIWGRTVFRTHTWNLLLNSWWSAHRWQWAFPLLHWTNTSRSCSFKRNSLLSGLYSHKLLGPVKGVWWGRRDYKTSMLTKLEFFVNIHL